MVLTDCKMWKKYLRTHFKRSTKQEPFTPTLQKLIHQQFERMTPMERWTAMSLIDNNKLVTRKRERSFVEETLVEEEIEDTIYICEECGSKKIDLVQKQLRGADEPMTCFLTCITCGEKWTEN